MKKKIKDPELIQFIKDMNFCTFCFVLLVFDVGVLSLTGCLLVSKIITFDFDSSFFVILFIFFFGLSFVILTISKKSLINNNLYIINLKLSNYQSLVKKIDNDSKCKKILNNKNYCSYSHTEDERLDYKLITLFNFTNGRKFSIEAILDDLSITYKLKNDITRQVLNAPRTSWSLTYTDIVFVNEINADVIEYLLPTTDVIENLLPTKVVNGVYDTFPFYFLKMVIYEDKLYISIKFSFLDTIQNANGIKKEVLKIIEKLKDKSYR